MIALFLACSGGDADLLAGRDPCCSAADAGVAVWDTCHDTTVKRVTCEQTADGACCEVGWTAACATFYAEFASTCSAPTAGVGAGAALPEVGRASDFAGLDRVRVALTVEVDPAPEQTGGNVFYAGFAELDPNSGGPPRGQPPTDYGMVATWVAEFPVTAEIELSPGLHYFGMYGFGSHPQPGDRMGELVTLAAGASTLKLVISDVTVPSDGGSPQR